uniref:Uncharacterized protein n=1 Tax=Chloracidobacterium thermophilum TaxID=458033 RepID=A8DJD1_9BACT|nr:hypothetical protein YS_M60-F11.024 [Chloracidobacterium thermophilum]
MCACAFDNIPSSGWAFQEADSVKQASLPTATCVPGGGKAFNPALFETAL